MAEPFVLNKDLPLHEQVNQAFLYVQDRLGEKVLNDATHNQAEFEQIVIDTCTRELMDIFPDSRAAVNCMILTLRPVGHPISKAMLSAYGISGIITITG